MITSCACVHGDRYECFRLRYGGIPELHEDEDMPRECCECDCHDDYEEYESHLGDMQ